MDVNFTPHPQWSPPTPPFPLPYVSRAAVQRVKDPIAIPTECPCCGGSVKLCNNAEIYGVSIGNWPFAYACQKCGEAYVGVHPDTAIPLGTMADKALRGLRAKAKQSFHDYLIKAKMDRRAGYAWLSSVLGIPMSNTHFGFFNTVEAKRALDLCNNLQKEKPNATAS